MDALVVVSRSPMNDTRVAEGVRIALGLMTYMDDIGILFTGDAVWAFNGLKPAEGTVMANSLNQIGMLVKMGQRVMVDEQACADRHVTPSVDGIEMVDDNAAHDAVLTAKHILTVGV